MKPFKSNLAISSKSFVDNKAANLALIRKLREIEKRAANKSEMRRERFTERAQLSPRERLAALLDPGLPFLELFNLAGYLVDDENPNTAIPGANIIAGIGYVSSSRCMIWVDDSGINAGAITMKSVEKGLACIEMAKAQKLPLIHLVESAGVNLMAYTVELWANAGGFFGGLAELSAMGIPTVTVLHGPSTAGGAYQPGLSDFVIGIKKNGMAALAGSALVKAATGEISSDDDLGSVEMHSEVTGLVEYLAENDAHGIEIARDVVENLAWQRGKNTPNSSVQNPRYPSEEIMGLVPTDYKTPYDVRELVARIVDDSSFIEFKPRYGISTVCLQTKIFGVSCGVIGNNGPIDPNGATKATHFFQLCDHTNLPIIFLNNTTGFMVGKKYEHAGMIKHGSKMIQAVTNVTVPKISLYIGASFGAGNYGMCGYAFKPDFLFSWPNSKTGVMGGQQAASTMENVMVNAAKRRGTPIDKKELRNRLQKVTDHFERQSEAFLTSGRLMDHGMIDPRDTRKVIGFCLSTCLEARDRKLKPNSFGIARV
ncbi:MAG: carboxyl transferase domain-containing protein [Pseudomonadota bacterium]|nr:carboxyl transferase domain-containing protein [Pseudomonadota bacterium]